MPNGEGQTQEELEAEIRLKAAMAANQAADAEEEKRKAAEEGNN